jgi:ABC-type transport system involved in cytochrome c biogenesis ATPase subunit/GNAT superfamily N-acetyltransferase
MKYAIKRTTRIQKQGSVATLLTVVNSSTNGHLKKISLKGNSKSIGTLELPRFSLIGEGDKLELKEGIERRAWIKEKNGADPVQILPSYEVHEKIDLAGHSIKCRIAEISTSKEFLDYQNLSDFHYKGLDFVSSDTPIRKKGIGGRKGILLLQIFLGREWQTIGYIELQMPLMMAKPRHTAFARPFKHPTLPVSWQKWHKGGQALVNRIVRISRVVVHPEFRSAGLSKILVTNAINFSKERWHVGGKKPLFLEISAEMLRYIDFVSSCGFHYLGETEGNKSRLVKDMFSMSKGRKGASGIMSLQRRYYSLFEAYREKTGESFSSLQARLSEILSAENPLSVMTTEEWLALRPVIRTPIPYYMIGLDEHSDNYIKAATVDKASPVLKLRKSNLSEILFHNIQIQSNYKIKASPYNRLVMENFGITARILNSTLVNPISFSASPGTVTFISGSSGSGKSVLLSKLDPSWKSSTIKCLGSITPKSYSVSWLKPLPEDVPIFEYLANKYNPEKAFGALSKVGLSEALLFLKPFSLLSRGQRYRAMLADLILGNSDVWIIDEFCSDLDPISASLVAHRFRQIVAEEKRIAFVAAANHRHFINSLKPSKIIRLRLGETNEILNWKEYSNELSKQII